LLPVSIADCNKAGDVDITAYPENGSTLLRQTLEGGYTGDFLFNDGLKAQEVVDAIGAEFLNGTYGTTSVGSTETPGAAIFAREYEKHFGELPNKPYISNSYDAMFLLALAIEKAGSTQSTAIRDALRAVANPPGEIVTAGEWEKAKELIAAGKNINYQGASGDITFDEHGDTIAPIGIWRIENGAIVDEGVVSPQK